VTMARVDLHEDLRADAPAGGSDRSFGVVFTLVFSLVGLWPLTGGRPIRPWGVGIAGLFLVTTLARPRLLHPLNVLWTRLGLVLARVTNPIVTALLFYLVFVPVGLALRWAGKDLLAIRPDPGAESYWVERRPPGPTPKSMANQF
jgi:Saxitoxin biosynthesis operon protein SxtJ